MLGRIKLIILTMLFGMLLSSAALAQTEKKTFEGKTEWDHGIVFWKSTDDQFSGRFDARAFINGAYFFEDKNKLSNGTHLRKARFALKMKLWNHWRAEWDMDIAEGEVEVKDMWLSYHVNENSYLKFGHFKVPFGLEILTSSRYIPFAERAQNALAFKMGRRLGVEAAIWEENWNLRADIFGQAFDTNKNKTKDETGGGLAARFAFAPIINDDMIFHTGVAAAWERPDDDVWIVDYNAEPETKIGDVEILDTDLIKNTSNTIRYGLETAFVFNNVHAQAEYQNVMVNRFKGLKTASFEGMYVYVLYTLTGESRKWDPVQGEFGQLIPDDPDLGIIEAGLRYSHLNLTDEDAGITGGGANNLTAALNWYPNTNMVMQTNVTHVMTSATATGGGFAPEDAFTYVQFMAKFFF